MTRISATIAYRLLHQLIYTIRTRGGNKDTYILNHLMEAHGLMVEIYPFLSEEKKKKLERIVYDRIE